MKTIIGLISVTLTTTLLSAGNAWAASISNLSRSVAMDNLSEQTAQTSAMLLEDAQSDNGDKVFEKEELFRKRTYFTDMFEIDAAGTYQAILTDFKFPTPLAEVQMEIKNGTDSLGSLFEAGSLVFDAEPGKYTISFYASNALVEQASRYGLYSIGISSASATAVPVPAAIWLFGSGLLGLVGIDFKRRRSI